MSKEKLAPDVIEGLLKDARDARAHAYAPYSGFRVGAAVRTKSGQVYTGANVENAVYGCTICAERVAIFKAISEGHDDIELMVVTAEMPAPIPPCGPCRQVLAEFNPQATVIMANVQGETTITTLTELLPHQFKLEGIDEPTAES